MSTASSTSREKHTLGTVHEIEHQRRDHYDPDDDYKLAELHDYYTKYPNHWAYIRNTYLREAVSEFVGTMLLIIFGTGTYELRCDSKSGNILTGFFPPRCRLPGAQLLAMLG